jgi:small subunit ribosomal protein S5
MEWKPRTELGRQVAEGKITIDEIFATGKKIKEAEIIDRLLPGLQSEIIFIGGSPGKGGGIKRTPTRRTARMHRSGRRYRISAMVVVGNGDGYVGMGKSVSTENRLALEKATENAKLNVVPVIRGCGSWQCTCGEAHTVPVEIEGKSGSVRVKLFPAPKGIGLCVSNEAKKIMRLAGIKDIWTKRFGESRSRSNYAAALFDAFRKMNMMRLDARAPAKEAEDTDAYEDDEVA